MARPLRVEYPNACYHVMNRGNRGQTVFERDTDCELFLKKLAEYAEKYLEGRKRRAFISGTF